jgi:hypothetical protein
LVENPCLYQYLTSPALILILLLASTFNDLNGDLQTGITFDKSSVYLEANEEEEKTKTDISDKTKERKCFWWKDVCCESGDTTKLGWACIYLLAKDT